MSLTVALSQSTVSAPPGEQVLLEVEVRNTGTIVDRYAVTVLGDAARWATVEPATVALNPGQSRSAFVRFDIPRRSDIAAGQVPFAIKVASEVDPTGSVVEEGVLDIGAFRGVSAELLPRTARGRGQTRHQVAIDNRGNTRCNAVLEAKDPDGLLAFRITPPALTVEPSTAAFARVSVRARRTFLRGPAETHPFQVVVNAEGETPMVLDGVMLQEARLPAWSVRAALAAIALLLVLALFWLAVLKPQVRSTAKDVVREPLARTNEAVNKVGAAVGQDPNLPTGDPTAGGGDGGDSATTTTTSTVPEALVATNLGNPFDVRLEAGGTTSYRVPDDMGFSLTDVVFQNPAGDSGTITLRKGDKVLFRDSLANFRSVDYHFVAPIFFPAGSSLVLDVDCRTVGTPCTSAAQIGGFLKKRS